MRSRKGVDADRNEGRPDRADRRNHRGEAQHEEVRPPLPQPAASPLRAGDRPPGAHDHAPWSRTERHVSKASIAGKGRVLRSSFLSSTIRLSPPWRFPYGASASWSPVRMARSTRPSSRRTTLPSSEPAASRPDHSSSVLRARWSSRTVRTTATTSDGAALRPERLPQGGGEPSPTCGAQRSRCTPDRRRQSTPAWRRGRSGTRPDRGATPFLRTGARGEVRARSRVPRTRGPSRPRPRATEVRGVRGRSREPGAAGRWILRKPPRRGQRCGTPSAR